MSPAKPLKINLTVSAPALIEEIERRLQSGRGGSRSEVVNDIIKDYLRLRDGEHPQSAPAVETEQAKPTTPALPPATDEPPMHF